MVIKIQIRANEAFLRTRDSRFATYGAHITIKARNKQKYLLLRFMEFSKRDSDRFISRQTLRGTLKVRKQNKNAILQNPPVSNKFFYDAQVRVLP